VVAINRLTARGIAGLADGNHSDGANLYLRKKGQRASWVFRYKLKARVKELGLGSYPSRSLSEARKVAAELRTQLLDGLPVRSLKSQRQDTDFPTLRESALAYIEAKRPEWTNKKHAQQWINTLETYVFPKIGDYLPSEVDLSAIESVLQPIWTQKTETATRIRQRLEAILDWTIVHGYRSADNPARWKNNLERVFPSPAKISPVSHFSAVPVSQIPELCQRLRASDALSSQILLFLILTAVRSGEARGARWEEVDFASNRWIIPSDRKKERRSLAVPLSEPAIQILKIRSVFSDGEYIFGGKPLSDTAVSKQLKRYAGNYTVHGLRSSFRQWAAETTQYPEHVLEKALGHSSGSHLIDAYQRSDLFEQRRDVMQDWANYCLGE